MAYIQCWMQRGEVQWYRMADEKLLTGVCYLMVGRIKVDDDFHWTTQLTVVDNDDRCQPRIREYDDDPGAVVFQGTREETLAAFFQYARMLA